MPSSFGNCVPRSPLDPGLRRARLLGALALIDHWSRLATCLALRAYRCLLSPVLGGNCRFEPSCSAYAEQAIERHGCGGVGMAIRRLLRCHPWGGPGGFDPVL